MALLNMALCFMPAISPHHTACRCLKAQLHMSEYIPSSEKHKYLTIGLVMMLLQSCLSSVDLPLCVCGSQCHDADWVGDERQVKLLQTAFFYMNK